MDNKGSIELKPCPFCGAEVSIAAMTGRHTGRYSFCHHGGARPGILGFQHWTYDKCIVRDAIVFDNYRDAREWANVWNHRAEVTQPTTKEEP